MANQLNVFPGPVMAALTVIDSHLKLHKRNWEVVQWKFDQRNGNEFKNAFKSRSNVKKKKIANRVECFLCNFADDTTW